MDEIGQRTTLGVPHLLIHGEAGDPQHVVAPSLEDAMVYADYLANERGDRSFQVFELREIEMSVRQYYSVHLLEDEDADAAGGTDPMGDAAAIPGIQPISLTHLERPASPTHLERPVSPTHLGRRAGAEMPEPAVGDAGDVPGLDPADDPADGTVEFELCPAGTEPGSGIDRDDSFGIAEPEVDAAGSRVVQIFA